MKKIFYAHSGGVTSVINATLVSLIKEASHHGIEVLIGINGIHGLKKRAYFSSFFLSEEDLDAISQSPGGSFGSCRYKLNADDLLLLSENIKKDGIEAIIYQGGNDSQGTLDTLSKHLKKIGSPCKTIGLPKTIDNDLFMTDVCPGFGSASLFLALSFRQLCLDLQSMCEDSTKIYLMETMGRNAGWLSAAAGMSDCSMFPGPQMVLIPECPVSDNELLERIDAIVKKDGFCAISVSEGFRASQLESFGPSDSFGNKYLEGGGLSLKSLIQKKLHYKTRLCIPDYLQRSFALLKAERDYEQSCDIGAMAINTLIHKDYDGVMITIKKNSDTSWTLDYTELTNVAGAEQKLPKDFFNHETLMLSAKGRKYMEWVWGEQFYKLCEPFWPHIHSQKIKAYG